MMPPNVQPPPTARFAQALRDLLGGQRRRIRRRFITHGLGRLAAGCALACVVYYALDRLLLLPAPLRLAGSAALVVWGALAARRHLAYPLRRALRTDDVAVAVERHFPQLREQLISAVQLADSVERGRGHSDAELRRQLRNQSPAMIERLVADAAAQAQSLPLDDLLDPRPTRTVWAAAAAAAIAVVLTAASNWAAFQVFLQRAVGAEASYPRLTTLIVELPESDDSYRIERTGRTARVTMAAGADLPVLVRCEGSTPREVFLAVSGGRGLPPRVSLSSRGSDRYRHVFRRVSAPFSFHAFGGDDPRGDLDVEVITEQPPRVGTIRATLEYPSYTGLAPVTQSGGSIEALAGTRVQLQVTTTSAAASGVLAFLESGEELSLERQTIADDGGAVELLTGSFTVQQSDRYHVRLVGPSGLRNPHPGTYAVVAVADLPPTGKMLAPGENDLGVVLPTGVVPLRVEAKDDFGLQSLAALLRVSRYEELRREQLLPPAAAGAAPTRHAVVTALFEVAELASPSAAVAVGDTISLGVALVDNRQPESLTTEIPSRQIHVVGQADLARRIAGHFRRIRDAVEELLTLQVGLQDRLADAEAELAAGHGREPLRNEIIVLQVGQARVRGGAARLHAELMQAFDLHLFNRLDDSPHAAEALRLYASYHREHGEPAGHLPGFYRMLQRARQSGQLGASPKTLDPILDMTLACDRMAEELAPATVNHLEQAGVAAEDGATAQALAAARAVQQEIRTALEQLRAQLEEWNEFQDVIIQTRAVLDKQREVQVRTRDSMGDVPGAVPAEPSGGGEPPKERR